MKQSLKTILITIITVLLTSAMTISAGLVFMPEQGGTGLEYYDHGDLIYFSSTTDLFTRISTSTDGYVLTMVNNVPAWAAGGDAATWITVTTNAISPTTTIGIIVNASSTMATTTFFGEVDIIHTAFENNDHSLEIISDLAGFGGGHAFDIVFETGAVSAGEDEAAILVNIDESASTGGDIFGLEILSTAAGSAGIYALKVGATINPISQLSGVFGDMDSASTTVETDDLTAFTSTTVDVSIFDLDNDAVTIGDAAKFEEIEFILAIDASNPGIKPVFEFWNGSAWVVFAPIDGTNGMRNSGIIAWDDADIPTWAVDGNTEYAIRISRTQNSLNTVPTEDIIQISAVTIYKWDKDGRLNINSFVSASSTLGTVTSGTWNGTLIDISSYTNLTAGRSLTMSADSVEADSELYTFSDCKYIEDPTAADDLESLWRYPFAWTVTEIWCDSDQTIDFDLQEDDGSPADIMGTDLQCATTENSTTTGFSDSAIAADSEIDLITTSVSGTPTWVSICIHGTKND